MPCLIITFIPAHRAAERETIRPDHLAFLDAEIGVVLAAGAKLHEDGSVGEGSFYLVDVETHEAATAFIERDPYHRHGLIEDVSLTRVRTGFFNRQRRPA